jgi:hypothetical protein
MKRTTAVASGIALLLAGFAALAWIGVVPNPFVPPKPPLPEGELPGTADPFHVPDQLGDKPADPDGFERDRARREREARLKRWQELAARGDRAFRAASDFPANPDQNAGLFRFDLRLVEYVDGSRAKGEFTQYVNTRDGSVALFDPEDAILAMNGEVLPDVTLEFVLLRPGGNALACGVHKQFGKGCIDAGGARKVATGHLQLLNAMQDWLDSTARTAQTLPPTSAYTQPDADAQPLRGKFVGGQAMTLWREPGTSRIATHIPWLGFGAGLYKDYDARRNRVAQVAVFEGADLHGGNLAFKLLDVAREQRSFDTRRYPQITAFSADGRASAAAVSARLGGNMVQRQMQFQAAIAECERQAAAADCYLSANSALIGSMQDEDSLMRRAIELEAQLRACPQGDAGRDCRRLYRDKIKATNEDARDTALEWARSHGLPVPAD